MKMNNRDHHGEYHMFTTNNHDEQAEDNHRSLLSEDPCLPPLQANDGSIAYQLLLLQQRLAAYERLHLEEMNELRRDLERLCRLFLLSIPGVSIPTGSASKQE